MARDRTNRVIRDGRCTSYLPSGAGRCPNPATGEGLCCETCSSRRKGWGSRVRTKRQRPIEAPDAPAALPAWMSDPSLLPKRPPGKVS